MSVSKHNDKYQQEIKISQSTFQLTENFNFQNIGCNYNVKSTTHGMTQLLLSGF